MKELSAPLRRKSLRSPGGNRSGQAAPRRMRLPARAAVEGFLLVLGLLLAALVWTWVSWAG
jgi:hypothetical protein